MSERKKKVDPEASTREFQARKEALDAFSIYTEEMLKKETEAMTKTFAQIMEEDKPVTTYVEELGCNIKFRGLTVKDQLELDDIEDDLERGNEMLFRMWRNGDATVKRESFDKLEADKKNAILTAILRKQPFLPLKVPKELLEVVAGGGQSK